MPVSHLIEAMFDLAIGLVMLAALMLSGGLLPSAHIIFLPAFLLLMVTLVFGLTAWTAALNVMFRDIKFIVQFAIQVGFFATPVIFPVSFVPEHWRWVMTLNPLAAVIEGARWSILGTATLPDLETLAIGWLVALAIAVTGYRHFLRAERGFADLI
jgi:lipopolysaccharide transport system permease protein